jgi:secretion/DNA translocation related TadE-like protein
MMAVLLTVTTGGFYIGSAVVARHRTQSTADMAALAAAMGLPEGAVLACGHASEIARTMKVDLAACDVDELDVVVTVQAGPARAAARAGPVSGPP